MIVIFYLLLVLGLGHCQDNDLPTVFEIESSINRTIEEVERLVREDPRLPMLTRQQIVNILYNITSKELDAYQDKEKMERARKMYQRALMVVLPYNAQDSSENLKDLYTKPPMTQIVPDVENLNESNDKVKKKEEVIDLKDAKTRNPQYTTPSNDENLVSPSNSYDSNSKNSQSTTVKNRYKNHRETYSEVHTKAPLKETLKLDSAPVRFTFNLENLQRNALSTERTTVTRRPVYHKDTSTRRNDNSNIEVVYSTSVNMEPTMKTESEEITIDLKEETKTKQNILSSDQWRYNAPPSTTLKSTASYKFNRYREKMPFLPTTIRIKPEDGMIVTSTKGPETFTRSSEATTEPASNSESEESVPLYVTPMTHSTSQKSKYSSTYSLNSGGFRTASTTTSQPLRSEVMDLLASIGLSPDNGSNVEDVYNKNKDMLDSKFHISDTNSVFHSATSGLSAVAPDSASIVNQNTFESSGSQLKKGMANLTPDVQLLFQKFGLQTSNLEEAPSTTTRRTTVNSYTNFKPLPTSNVKDQEMKEFLAKFGLGVNERRQKAMEPTRKPPSLIEAVPNNMRNILENIGLISNSRKNQKDQLNMDDMEATETSKYHVFKPHEVNVQDESQRIKIHELLDTVKMVQDGKANVQDVQKIANELLSKTKTLKNGPDPLSLEEIIRIYNEDLKNEVKRQQEETTTVSTVSGEDQNNPTSKAITESLETTSPDSQKSISDLSETSTAASEAPDSATSATVTSTASPNLMALEESFGGSTRAPDPVIPPRRKSGLYFLVDWNSFLEVGEDGQGKVNLRFQPKVGDRTRFLPVSVP